MQGGEGFAAIRALLDSAVDYQRIDAFDLDELGETFDLILCFGILHRVENPLGLLKIMRRRLAAGGRVLLETHGAAGEPLGVERAESEAIYDQGRETVVAVLLRMDEQIQRLTKQVAKQGEQIAELERRLGRNSRNSSTPPSQDPPGAPERKRPDPCGRAQGAQPGHRSKGRKLFPAEAVDRVVSHWPARGGCGHCFAEVGEETGEPARHQVTELPEIAVQVTEHRLHRRRCPECGSTTRAELPAEVPAGAFGPRMEAAVATLARSPTHER